MTLKSELEAKAFEYLDQDDDSAIIDKVVRLSDVLAIVELLEKRNEFYIEKINELDNSLCESEHKADLLDALCEVILTAESIRFAHGGEYVWTTIENQMDSEEFETPLAAIENLVETFNKKGE